MNNDPGAAGREAGIALWLWQVSKQTFWTFLDPASEVLAEVEGERCTQQRPVGVLRRGLGSGDECWRNAPGMSDGAF